MLYVYEYAFAPADGAACFRCGGHGYPDGSRCPECRGAGTFMHAAYASHQEEYAFGPADEDRSVCPFCGLECAWGSQHAECAAIFEAGRRSRDEEVEGARVERRPNLWKTHADVMERERDEARAWAQRLSDLYCADLCRNLPDGYECPWGTPQSSVRPLAVTVHETTEVPGWPPGTERVEGDHYACVYNAPCMHHEVVRGLDHERRNGWRFVGQADIDGVGDCLVFWRM